MKRISFGKRMVIIGSSAAVVLLLLIFILSTFEATSQYAIDIGLVPGEEDESADSDGDGLLDWEEILWKTDPLNADTDGDGTDDYMEIQEGRNPLVPGPDDSIDNHPIFDSHSDEVKQSTTTTGRITRRLIADYSELSERGIPVGEYTQQTLINNALEEGVASLPQVEAYTLEDITTHTDTSVGALRAYGNTAGRIIDTYSPKQNANEYVSVLMALYKEDYTYLNDLDPIIKGYGDIRDELRTLSVPENIQEEHLHLVNSTHLLHHITTLMRNIEHDPVPGFAALNEYKDAANRLRLSLQKLKYAFNTHDISFSQTDDGYLFFAL